MADLNVKFMATKKRADDTAYEKDNPQALLQ